MQTQFENVSAEDRKLAIIAHGSILLTFVISITTGGIGTFAPILVPFLLWLVYRDRSPYVAFHALQATLYQIGLIALFLALAGTLATILLVVWLITAVLSMLVVGLVLIPVALFITAIAGIILALFPLAGLAYGLAAAWEVYNTDNFRYYWLADWLENRLAPQPVEA